MKNYAAALPEVVKVLNTGGNVPPIIGTKMSDGTLSTLNSQDATGLPASIIYTMWQESGIGQVFVIEDMMKSYQSYGGDDGQVNCVVGQTKQGGGPQRIVEYELLQADGQFNLRVTLNTIVPELAGATATFKLPPSLTEGWTLPN